MPIRETAFLTKKVGKSFGQGANRFQVLKGIDLEAYQGEILMLVGPSGCGKTTLISIIAGTMRSDEGEVTVFGKTLSNMGGGAVTKFRANHIGFIFQQFNLIPTLNLAENVSVPLLIQGSGAGKAEKKARLVLEKVGLGDRWRNRPGQLSGGQQQRVAIARALVHEPRLIICDEPTASLDAENGRVVMELFREVARAPGRSVVIVTHDNRIFPFADRIAEMEDGRISAIRDAPAEGFSAAH